MRRLLAIGFVVLLALGMLVLSAAALAEEIHYARVATSQGTLNMRADAKSNAKILKKLGKGTIVQVTGEDGEWTQIVYKDTTGYVMTSFLKEVGDDLPYTPITKDSAGDTVMAFKKAMYKLGYLKSEEINKKFDAAMEKALTKMQLMNGVELNPGVVSAELQALMEWGMLVKAKSGYLDTEADQDSGLTVSIYCWDIAGTLYEADQSVKLQISYSAQASGGQPPYTITVRKAVAEHGPDYADEVANPFSHIWSPSTDCIYVYATVVDAVGNTVTACTPFRYTLPTRYTDGSAPNVPVFYDDEESDDELYG